jgi:general secretion pathway protein F
MLAVPYFGKLTQKLAVARFARTLSTLLASGIGLLPALDIVKSIVDNTVLTRAIERARDAIREGQSIAPPLRESGLFPPLVVHMVAVGERSGQLEAMLAKAADAYDDEVENAVAALTTILEPIIIVFMGGVVLFIVLAILLPIFELNRMVK